MDVRLINEVREHETLYNIFDAKHKNVSVRNEAWEAIGEALHLPAPECKIMWNRLRNCYTNALKRRNTSKAVSSTPPWKYDNLMSFLLPYMRYTLATEEDSENNVDDQLKASATKSYKQNASRVSIKCEIEDKSKIQNATKKKRKREDTIVSSNVEIDSLKEWSGHDETDLFFLSMAKIVKKLQPIDQIRARTKIHQMVSEYEIKSLTSS